MNKLEEEKFKSAGINIIDPATTFIDSTVKFVGSGITCLLYTSDAADE